MKINTGYSPYPSAPSCLFNISQLATVNVYIFLGTMRQDAEKQLGYYNRYCQIETVITSKTSADFNVLPSICAVKSVKLPLTLVLFMMSITVKSNTGRRQRLSVFTLNLSWLNINNKLNILNEQFNLFLLLKNFNIILNGVLPKALLLLPS